MEHWKPRNTDVLSALVGEYQFLHLLRGRVYDKLIDYLIEVGPAWADEESDFILPTIKGISAKLGEKHVSKWIPIIADDLITINLEKPELFKTKDTYSLYLLHTYENSDDTSISYHIWTDKHFHINERFYWHFAKVKMYYHLFFIEDIRHEYRNGIISTEITLNTGSQNDYRKFLLQRALFENKISLSEVYKLSEYTIDQMLREIYR
ncbi:hypothetical protein RYH73_03370 [Olivibacter sp. CPCC 100613]|uniref:hypothetical protein n=1 Tax=Olivibacter sp. CPCC 100613 TaxID=3079931 RepID=UPI002FF72555